CSKMLAAHAASQSRPVKDPAAALSHELDPQQTLAAYFCCAAQHSSSRARVPFRRIRKSTASSAAFDSTRDIACLKTEGIGRPTALHRSHLILRPVYT